MTGCGVWFWVGFRLLRLQLADCGLGLDCLSVVGCYAVLLLLWRLLI